MISGKLLRNEPMSLHTSLKVGGTADLFAVPEDIGDLQRLLQKLATENISWLAVGRGCNLLVQDKGIRGAVISLERFNRIEVICKSKLLTENKVSYVKAEAGAENLAVVRFAQEQGLGGISYISGIPGTVGGAIRMNAGAYGEGILDRTERLSLLRDGELREYCISELNYGYRQLHLQTEDIVLAALFRLEKREEGQTEKEIHMDLDLRRSKHNVGFPSAGSFFKNPAGMTAWKLIEAAGMRGTRVGGAMVSEVHSNFLVNTGDATANDFLSLSAIIKNAVFNTSGVTLEEEVRIVGEN